MPACERIDVVVSVEVSTINVWGRQIVGAERSSVRVPVVDLRVATKNAERVTIAMACCQ